MTNLELQELCARENVKFTIPQQKIVVKLFRGAKLTRVNKHHMSGGEFRWIDYPGADPSYAGKVYKAFYNVFYQIKKQTGVVVPAGSFII